MSEGSSSNRAPTQSAAKKTWTKPWPRPAPRTFRPPSFDSISNLPDEILIIIGDNISVKYLAKCSRVSRRFYVVMQDCLWRKAEHRLFWLPMFLGAAKGNIPLMEESLRRGCPVSKVWRSSLLGTREGLKNGQTPLHLAVIYGHADAVDWLLSHGASTDVNHPRRLDEDLSLLLLAGNKVWNSRDACCVMSKEQLETWAREWQVPTGPCYRIFCALLQAGAKPPPGKDQEYLKGAKACCRIVSAPAIQQMLQHGANIHDLCTCTTPAPGAEPELQYENVVWWWDRFLACPHAVDFLPFSKSDRERIWANMCDTFREKDRKGPRFFCPEEDVGQ